MSTNSPQLEGSDEAHSSLTASIGALHLAEQNSSVGSAKTVFGTAGVLLATIRDSAVDEKGYVKLGISCADVCQALDRGLSEGRIDEPSKSVLGAIDKLTTTVVAIQKKIVKQGKQRSISRFLHARGDKEAIAAWGQDLDRILLVFNMEFSINNHGLLLDIRRDVQARRGGTDAQNQPTQASTPLGELPPPQPRACFGRNGLIEKIVGLADALTPIALIGAGGIGKTSVALAALHHDQVKQRFGDNRRFIRCDQFPASHANFLRQFSRVIGAGAENPKDLASLRSFLSSREMFIILDNAESVLDPQGTDAREIYTTVKELSQFRNLCLCVTSRIFNVPPHCKRVEIPTLSMEAARNIFYSIYGDGDQSGIIDNLLQRLDFHALSITLLATTAFNNIWDYDRLVKEWDEQRGQVLRTDHNESLATTIELSLTSPTFCKLGPNARDLLGVVAFFPRGIDEKNLDWLFTTISDRKNTFDKFCTLSLTYRNHGFITMLAPIQDYFCPRDPQSSPLLCATKDRYFTRLSVDLDPDELEFAEARWIKSEDMNVEHLLGVFISINPNTQDIWDACFHFMDHLLWENPRKTVLRSKIEALPDDHPSKPKCLFKLSHLLGVIGNDAEKKELLVHTLTLERERRDDYRVALTLDLLSSVNLDLELYKEGIGQAEEALEIFKRLGSMKEIPICLGKLVSLLLEDGQLDAAEDTVLRRIKLLPEKGREFQSCQSHRILGEIHSSKREKEKSIHHYEMALAIASSFNWQGELFWIHYALGQLFHGRREFNDANTHIAHAKSHAAENAYHLGRGMELQAWSWYRQCRLEEAIPEALGALDIFERLGTANDSENCRGLLRRMEQPSGESNSSAH